jgi:hypothetical protein
MLDDLIVIVPLLAGLALVAVSAIGIYRNTGGSNASLVVLGVAALLCIAPTVLNLVVKLPGGGEISLVREQLINQAQQLKADVGEQGADVKGQLAALRRRIENLERRAGAAVTPTAGPAAPATPADSAPVAANNGKVVVILYAQNRKDLAVQMENYLLQKGYSANSVYTDFTELSDANRLPAGSVAFVSPETDSSARNEVEKALRAKFPDVQKVTDMSSPKLASNAVQVRLF